MAGMDILSVEIIDGMVDMKNMREVVEKNKDKISSFMITYPSTCGVYEGTIIEMIDLIHSVGGLVNI